MVTLALAALTGLSWVTDGKAALSERIAVIETQMKALTFSVQRVENKIDAGNVK